MYLCVTTWSALGTFELWFNKKWPCLDNGRVSISLSGRPIEPLPDVMEPDPASGLLSITYHLPELVVNGHVADPGPNPSANDVSQQVSGLPECV